MYTQAKKVSQHDLYDLDFINRLSLLTTVTHNAKQQQGKYKTASERELSSQ
jgi:hypothetical protein